MTGNDAPYRFGIGISGQANRRDLASTDHFVIHKGVSGAQPHCRSFEQRIAGKPVRAMQAGAGSFTNSPQAGYRAAPVSVGLDAAHVVMGGGPHRNGVARRVDAMLPAKRIDTREAGCKTCPQSRPRIEENLSTLADLAANGTGNDISRGQLAARNVGHEPLTAIIDEFSTFAAHRFADQRQTRGAETASAVG